MPDNKEKEPRMTGNYSIIEVKLRLDPVPGWGHNAADHVKRLEDMLEPWYHPQVKLLGVEHYVSPETAKLIAELEEEEKPNG